MLGISNSQGFILGKNRRLLSKSKPNLDFSKKGRKEDEMNSFDYTEEEIERHFFDDKDEVLKSKLIGLGEVLNMRFPPGEKDLHI